MLCLALACGAAHAGAKVTERSKQKAAAEAERAGLQQKLSALKRDIGQTESAKDDAADTLAASEEAISNANRALHDLAAEQGVTNAKLKQLGEQHDKLAATVESQKKQLAQLVRQQYVAGNEDRIKLLLSGDNPNRINRDLQMMVYVSQAQARLLDSLRANLKQVETIQAEAQDAKDDLEEIAEEQIQQKAALEQEKSRHAALLATLSQRLVAQRKEAGNVERDEVRMAGLVDKLGKLIEQQAEAAAAEKRRLEQVAAVKAAKARADAEERAEAKARALAVAKARAEAERERLALLKAKPGIKLPPLPAAPAKPLPAADDAALAQQKPSDKAAAQAADKVADKSADKPADKAADKPVDKWADLKEQQARPAAPAAAPSDIALAPAAPEGAFASLRGELRAPVAGKVAAKFGSKRGDGPSWKGVFIRASEGSDVHAVAAGRVVFAEWLRGFGNLIIVDHGGQYMSIYGNNQALLKRAGDIVKGGETIANAGNSGGNEESGLYFELRHQGRAFDPATWVKF
ncbi:peptidoglycan DD-metalloendopeptidase family protein [Rugamonas sp.]|uniref:murein hydrolase activator EnvC family protein n=1 Tax=Rugamonas sp. TaxID=1926287 RepID=UPI0025F81A6B|nr:peptidoglycan DD-metalloendopeptidase family protein [Rugamonas sp.]